MQFLRTGKRAPKGLRTSEILELETDGKPSQGTFTFLDPNTLMLVLKDGTPVVMIIQRATTYSVKAPIEDALARAVGVPADNDADEETPPLNPK